MATTRNVSSQYNGALAGEIFVQAFKKADTINKGVITILPNIIGTGYLPKLTYSQNLAEYSCGFTATGTVGYTDKSVATKKYEIKDEFCKNDFHSTFEAQAAGLFSASSEIPATVQDAILLAMVHNMGAIVDREIWQGDGTTGHFAGLLAQFDADTEITIALGNKFAATASITSSNVLSEIGKVYNAIPEAVYNEPDLVFVVSNDVARAYKQALAAQVSIGNFNGDKNLDYLGLRIESVAGLPSRTILAYRVKNVAFLTGLESDMNDVRVIDLDAVDGSDLVRTKIVFNAGVGYSFGSEIVVYKA